MKNPITLAQKAVNKNQMQQLNGSLELIEGLEIETDVDQEFAVDLLREVKTTFNDLDGERKSIVQPINASVKKVNDLFRPATDLLKRAEKVLKGKIAGYVQAKEDHNRELERQVAEAEDPEEAQEALAQYEEASPPAGTSIRHKWRAEVFSPSLVPYNFCSPDIGKLEQYAKEWADKNGGEVPNVPGVRFEREAIVTARSK